MRDKIIRIMFKNSYKIYDNDKEHLCLYEHDFGKTAHEIIKLFEHELRQLSPDLGP